MASPSLVSSLRVFSRELKFNPQTTIGHFNLPMRSCSGILKVGLIFKMFYSWTRISREHLQIIEPHHHSGWGIITRYLTIWGVKLHQMVLYRFLFTLTWIQVFSKMISLTSLVTILDKPTFIGLTINLILSGKIKTFLMMI